MKISPRAQAMLGKVANMHGHGSVDEFFEEGFREMALHRLMTEMPELADQIVSLKILDTSVETDSAVATFIILMGDDEVHIPAILSENTMAPFDIMYVRSLDQFLPLTEDWLIELERMDAASMGDAVETPENLRSDQDVRNLVVPPTTGRYSYASGSKLLPAYLENAGNMVKKSFVRTLEKHQKIAQYVFQNYDLDDLKRALRPHRHKAASTEGDLTFVTLETPISETKAVYGDNTLQAAKEISDKGYAAKDTRKNTNKIITERGPLSLQVPDTAGFYRVFLTDGTSPKALVFPKVLTVEGLASSRSLGPGRDRGVQGECRTRTETSPGHMRTIITEDGRCITTENDFVAQALPVDQVTDKLKGFLGDKNARTPRNGQRGFFCDVDGKLLTALEPLKIKFVTNKDGCRYIQANAYSGDYVNVTQIKDSPIAEPKVLSSRAPTHNPESVSWGFQTKKERESEFFDYAGSEVVLVPWKYKFVPITEVIPPDHLIRDADAVTTLFHSALTDSGAKRLTLKNAHAGQLSLDNVLYTPFEAVKKLATDYRVNVPDAEHAVKLASANYDAEHFYVISPQVEAGFKRRIKRAYGMPEEGDMPPEEEMDPHMMGPEMMDPHMMGPAMMGPPPPPPPSPVELAAQEIMDQVLQSGQEVMNQLITKKQSLQTQMGVLEAVVHRAQQIEAEQMGYDAGEPVGAPPVAMPPPPTAGDPAAEMGAPAPGEMTPDMHGGPPGAGAMGPEMGMEPGMEAGMGPEMGHGMPVEEPHAMEQAMAMEDPDLFDAASIASMAEHNDFDNTVAQFIPVFQEALDALGRTLMELRMKGSDLREQMGEVTYTEILDAAEMLFGRLGELIVRINETIIGGAASE